MTDATGPEMREVLACPYRFDPDAAGRATCTIDRAVGDVVRLDTCVRCVRARHPELASAPPPRREPEAASGPPPVPVVHRWVGDARYADAAMDGRFAGAKAFLVCGGPSLAAVDVAAMNGSGALVMAVNNAGAYPGVRPHFWACVDNPASFHQNIWLDPGICKLVPMTRAGNEVRRKDGGVFSWTGRLAWQFPNVLFYERNSRFSAASFLPEPTVNWGCDPKSVCSEGRKGVLSVMLAALKLLFVLGAREIYLVGADFRMDQERPYAFPQRKDPVPGVEGEAASDPIGSNNRGYAVLAERFRALRPHLSREGVTVLNATEGSALDAFPAISFRDAVARAGVGLQSPPDLSGWYL